jgi:hypothetical protein
MGASASALPVSLAVDPGSEQSCWIQIRNNGEVVDEFTFEVLGEAARWADLDPPALSLFPGAEGELKLSFHPPRVPTTPVGMLPFGLKVTSKERPADAIVEEGALAIAPFDETNAELTPRTSHGRLKGKHELAFDNRGNTAVSGELEGLDPDDALTFSFKPPSVDASPGTATFTKVRARPRKRFFRGPPKTLPFQVRVSPERGEPRVVDGAVVQESLIPKWALLALLALAALALLWAFVLRPEIESTAKDAARDEVAAQQNDVDQATKDAAAAAKSAQAAEEAAVAAQQAAEKAAGKQVNVLVKTPNTVRVATGLSGAATSYQLQAKCPPTCTVSQTIPTGKRFALTDIVLSNPNADAGTVTLKRGESVLFVENLSDFRGLDFHFVAPILFSGGSKLTFIVACKNPSSGSSSTATTGPCTPAALVGGFLQQPKQTKKSASEQ